MAIILNVINFEGARGGRQRGFAGIPQQQQNTDANLNKKATSDSFQRSSNAAESQQVGFGRLRLFRRTSPPTPPTTFEQLLRTHPSKYQGPIATRFNSLSPDEQARIQDIVQRASRGEWISPEDNALISEITVVRTPD